MFKGLRYWRSLWVPLLIIFLLTSVSSMLWADKLSTDKLIERATNDLYSEFMQANSRALVAAYIILGQPLSELEQIARMAIRTWGNHQLAEALEAGRQGDHIEICYHPQEFEDHLVKGRHLSQMSMEELDRLTFLEGIPSAVRKEAATLLVRRAIEDAEAKAGTQIGSWYAFRVEYEHDPFDPLKDKLQREWMFGSSSPELRAATIIPLAQMYLAEHFVWWDTYGEGKYKQILEEQLECTDDEPEHE